MSFLFRWFVIVLACVCCSAQTQAATLHAILIGDTLSEGINEFNAVKGDLQLVKKEIDVAAIYTSMEVKTTLMVHTDATPAGLSGVLNQLKVDADDVILFYVITHGHRTVLKDNANGNLWPNITLPTADLAMDFGAIVATLQKKGARLLLAFAEACNNYYSVDHVPPVVSLSLAKKTQPPRKYDTVEAANYKKLFLETKGTIVASSCKPGQKAWVIFSPYVGFLFTRNLFKSLKEEVKLPDGAARWDSIFDRTIYLVSKFKYDPQFEGLDGTDNFQTPQYMILK